MTVETWSPSITASGPVLGSARDFVERFRRLHGYEPEARGAAAAAAGLALQLAVEQAGSVEPAAVREAFSTLDVTTFWGRLAWDTAGRNRVRRAAGPPAAGRRRRDGLSRRACEREAALPADRLAPRLSGRRLAWSAAGGSYSCPVARSSRSIASPRLYFPIVEGSSRSGYSSSSARPSVARHLVARRRAARSRSPSSRPSPCRSRTGSGPAQAPRAAARRRHPDRRTGSSAGSRDPASAVEPGIAQPRVRRIAGQVVAELDALADQHGAQPDPVLAGRRHFQLVPAEQALAVAGAALRGEHRLDRRSGAVAGSGDARGGRRPAGPSRCRAAGDRRPARGASDQAAAARRSRRAGRPGCRRSTLSFSSTSRLS